MYKIRAVCRLLLTLLIVAIFNVAATAEESTFPGVQKLMSEQEFSASGLEKLSPAEIRALNQWLIRYTAGEAQVLITTDEEVIAADRDQEILSSIKEPFRGWSGSTVFRLENGQEWKQRRRGNYFHDGTEPPTSVTVKLATSSSTVVADTV